VIGELKKSDGQKERKLHFNAIEDIILKLTKKKPKAKKKAMAKEPLE
jgi:hypothetical protein